MIDQTSNDGSQQVAPQENMPSDNSQTQGTIPQNDQQTEELQGTLVNEDKAELSPAQQSQLDAYNDNATTVVFSSDSQPAILQSLQQGKNQIQAVADTAFIVNKKLEGSLSKTGEKLTEITLCLGCAHLVSELILLAEAAKLYKMDEVQRMECFRQSVMKYFAEGLKDGSINPVKLQQTLEPLMNDKQRQFGLNAMQQQGISKTAPPDNVSYRNTQNMQQPQQQGILARGVTQ